MRHALIAAAALLLAGCDQPLLSAQLEIPELRITTAPQNFDGPPVDPQYACSYLAITPDNCVATPITYDVGAEVPMLGEKGVTFDLRMTDVAFHLATGETTSLAGIRTAKVEVRQPGTGSYVEIASYDATVPSSTMVSDVRITGNTSLDMAPFLRAGSIDLRTELYFDPAVVPSTGINANVEAGFSLVVTVDYGSYL